MGELFNQIPSDAIKGEDITIGERYGGEFYISEYDEIIHYSGVLMKEDNRDIKSQNMWPYYMNGKHSFDKSISDRIINFIRIVDGQIVLEDYVDARWYSDKMFKKIEAVVRYPSADTYYCVLVNRREDEALTRAVFGLTYRELSQLTECYAKALGTYNIFQQYPRVTRSVRSANLCDITNAWIPEKFPYITFAESSFDFSHVSLWGFYRHVQLLMMDSVQSPVGQLLINAGAEPELLEKVMNIGRNAFRKTMINWDMMTAG